MEKENAEPTTVTLTAADGTKKEFPLFKSVFAANTSPIYISDNMTGKMKHFPSISTCVVCNPFCKLRIEKAKTNAFENHDCICAHCFAVETVNNYETPSTPGAETLKSHLFRNYDLLNNFLIPDELFPTLGNPRARIPERKTVTICRLESFGDLGSVTAARNAIRMARHNPSVRFALWTKNPGLLYHAIVAEGGKPENLVTVYSSPFIGETETLPEKYMACFDHRFTVYREKQTSEKLNCGARSCYTLPALLQKRYRV